MVDRKIAIDKEKPVFSIKISAKYEKNLQAALDYTLQYWGAVTMVNLHLQIIKKIDTVAFFPYSNAQNRFLNDVHYREIILQKFPFVITYRIDNDTIKIINIIHTSRNPVKRMAKR
ncbi:MAG: type II toxin-antitoxin system RelE/ParE family toxin [Bacteroidetes bacterium]|nr:type II toxin-antitoxin system RelE/ParE family toxin [Bacteroidota bacterium]